MSWNLFDLNNRVTRRLAFERGKAQLQHDLERLLRDAPAIDDTRRPRIGIASFGSGEWHLGIDVLLSHALALRGASPTLLVCDRPELPICDERVVSSRHQQRCDGCLSAKRTLLDSARVPWRPLSAFTPATAIGDAVARVAAISREQIDAFVEGGWPIGQWLHVSASHFLRRDARGVDAEQTEARRRWLATAIVCVHAVERWLDTVRPDIVMVQSGAHVRWRIARELAQRRGIPVFSREMAKGGWDRHLFALNSDAMRPDLDAAWAAARDVPLTATEDATVDRLLAALPADTHPPVPASRTYHHADDRRRTVVAFSNVTWDLATAGRDRAFEGVTHWLRETVAALACTTGAHLIIRAHPAEAATASRERIVDAVRDVDRSSDITVIGPEDGVTAPELFANADLVLVYNSTAGLEAACSGKPVVVCGDPHFGGRSFTIDVDSIAGYRALLARWSSGQAVSASPETSALARRYFHLFFARYTVALGLTTSPLEPPYALTLTSIDDLRPGRNAALDVVCDGILHGRQILLPRQAEASPCVA